jgi:glycosyltransferase involved in cell wall biosynthesis
MSRSTRTLLLVTPYFPPSGGGLERYAKHIASRLSQDYNWRLVVVCAGRYRGADITETIDGLTVHRLGYAWKISNTPFDTRWRHKLKRIILTEQPALINAHMPVPGLADVAAGVAGKIPFVVTYHAGSMKKGSLLVDWIIGAYEKFALPLVLRRAERIICSSDYVRKDFLKRYEAKSITINPGVDETIFVPATTPIRTETKTILFVGGYGAAYQHKGLTDLIAALPRLNASFPKLTLNIVGQGDDQSVRELAAQLGVEPLLRFLGPQDSLELAKLYADSSLVALPSYNDSFPMVLIEAMACGTPVVSTTAGGIPTVIEHGQTGLLVAPGDIKALTGAINSVLADAQLAERLGRAGQRRVLADLTWGKQAAATAEQFEDVLKPYICQVTAYFPPHLGGVETVVKELSESLAASGYRTEVLTSRRQSHGAATLERPHPKLTIRRLWGIEILNTPLMPNLLWRLLALPRRSVIHLHVAQAFVPEIAWLAAAIRGLPLIAHIHLDVEPSSAIGRLVFGPYKRVVLRHVLRHSTRVICLSEPQRTLMIQKYQLNPKRVIVLPNGVATGYFQPPRNSFHQPLRLLFVGRLALQKRPERIVEAMVALPHAHLDVVGEGDHHTDLVAFAHKHQLRNVTFHGIKRGHDLQHFYQNSDALVMTSDKEGMPLVLLEAMASGLPVVGSDVLGIRELIRGSGVLVPNPSAATFVQAIKTLNSAKLTQLSAAGRTAAEQFSWNLLTARLMRQYQEVQS